MHTLSTRALAALAYERGEEYDPAATPAPAVMEYLRLADRARPLLAAPSDYERKRRRERERRTALARVPDWFSADDLISSPFEPVFGEPS